jgi:hypothetical protein
MKVLQFSVPEYQDGLVIIGEPKKNCYNGCELYSLLNQFPDAIRGGLIRKIVTNTLEKGLSLEELKYLNDRIIKDSDAKGERINLHGYIEEAIKGKEADNIPF